MKGPVSITTDIQGNHGNIDITFIRPRTKRWLVEDILDTIEIDDAYYDPHDKLIHVANWGEKDPIDEAELRHNIVSLLQERLGDEYSIILR